MDYCAALILVGFVSLGCLGVVACVALEMRRMDNALRSIRHDLWAMRKEMNWLMWRTQSKEVK